jgi:hypothetical protein
MNQRRVSPARRSAAGGQQAFRTGYIDPLIAQTQGATFGVNKALPFLSDAFREEAGAMAPGNTLMQRWIGREQTMFETRDQALGGSRGVPADAAATAVDPDLVGQILSGNWHGAVRSVLAAGSNAVTGNTPAVRQAVADVLLRNRYNLAPRELHQMIGGTIDRIRFVQNIAHSLGRGAAGVFAVAATGQNAQR